MMLSGLPYFFFVFFWGKFCLYAYHFMVTFQFQVGKWEKLKEGDLKICISHICPFLKKIIAFPEFLLPHPQTQLPLSRSLWPAPAHMVSLNYKGSGQRSLKELALGMPYFAVTDDSLTILMTLSTKERRTVFPRAMYYYKMAEEQASAFLSSVSRV